MHKVSCPPNNGTGPGLQVHSHPLSCCLIVFFSPTHCRAGFDSMAPHIDDSSIGNPSLGSSQPAAAVAGGGTREPLAVVSMACRLPDECHTPNAFWKFMMEGKIAMNTPPGTRFDVKTHYDGSLRAQTMASPGGMFLQKVDPRDLDAQFFRLSGIEASSSQFLPPYRFPLSMSADHPKHLPCRPLSRIVDMMLTTISGPSTTSTP